ncbi:MAG: hypothetical protein JWM40_1442 [Frankiales bacterium]|nr:hypothetical protein [Frankiales bacterium]
MSWVLVDILIGVLALLVLAGVTFAGYKHVRHLLRTAKAAGAKVGAVTAEISALQDHSASHRTP